MNGLKKYYAHANSGIFWCGLKTSIEGDVFKVFTSLGRGRKNAA